MLCSSSIPLPPTHDMKEVVLTGAMIPGQFGPTSRVLSCVFSISVTRTMSCCGIPSVIHTTSGISALIASSIPAAATGGGTKMAEALAPACFTASATLAKTGLPKCSEPAFFGFVPPTTFVPYSIACVAWNVPCRPVYMTALVNAPNWPI